MRKHLNITVIGKVQGVFFRASAKKEAEKLGLCGFAQNVADGSVYIEVEGIENDLDEFVKWCKKGSSQAQVEAIEVKNSSIKNFTQFSIN